MIVTTRARIILLFAAGLVGSGLFNQKAFLVQLGLAAIIWIGIEWALFRFRTDSFTRRVVAHRNVSDRQGQARILWHDRPYSVSTTIHCEPSLRFLPSTWATIYDLHPMGTSVGKQGSSGTTVAFGKRQEHEIEYELSTETIGAVHFPGLRCVLFDNHGFFQAERFVPHSQSLRVLPLSQRLRTAAAIRKPRNAMPPPGIHSNAKAGAGSELLEIRDYVPGDPPRSIAWKVSARRDGLMTKQFESEVPVRCQMFVDMSSAVRIGYPGPCMANRLIEVATSAGNLLTSNRDAVGMSIFDGKEVHLTKPSASQRARLQMMDMLATSIDRPLEPVETPIDALLRPAFDIVRVRYPDAVHYVQNVSYGWRRLLGTIALALYSIPLLIMLRSPNRRLRLGMASVIANHYQLDELSMGELAVDDKIMSYWLQRFMSDHQVPYSGARYDKKGGYLFDDSHKIEQLSKLITHAATRARDSELFVIFAELCDTDYDLAPLTAAIRLAIARQHRVAVLCAWPDGINLAEKPIKLDSVLSEPDLGIERLVESRQRSGAYDRLRSELGKLRVPVAAATEKRAIPLIASELEIVRSGRAVA